MLSRLSLLLENEHTKKVTISMSSVFHGILMEIVGEETAAWLHGNPVNPYSQYIQYEEHTLRWTILTTTEEAKKRIIDPFMQETISQVYLSYHDITLKITDKHCSIMEKDCFLQQQYFTNFDRYFTIRFLSPASFKSKGSYRNYPTLHWIFQSLMHRHDYVDEENRIFDADVLETLEQRCHISNYRLRSACFSLEGVKIPSFLGSITICVRGNQSLVNLVNYLLMFGEYTGVGIKTSMGMGAVQVEHKERM